MTGATTRRSAAALWRALALVVGLPACTPLALSPEQRAADAAWEARRSALAALDRWQAIGRLSLQSGEQAWHASLVWEEDGDAYRIRLLGPLGQGGVEITGGLDQVTLRTARGETYTASDPETLMAEALGWGVPVRGLRHWLLGRDDPEGGVARPSLDAQGRPLALRQDGWEVQYQAYLPAEPVSLPGRLQLDREDLHARIVISRWDLSPR